MTRRQLVIVGAGPAGLAAATAAASAGMSPTLIEESSRIGGQIYRQSAVSSRRRGTGEDDRVTRRGAELLRRFHQYDNLITVLTSSTVWGLTPPRGVLAVREGKSEVIDSEHLILAPGAYEFVPPFPGWTLPGVMTPGGAQAMVKTMGVLPGQRVVLAGTGPFLLVVALALHEAGMEVVGIVEAVRAREFLPIVRNLAADLGLLKEGWDYLRKLSHAGIPIYRGHVIVEALGPETVREVVIAPCDSRWSPDRSRSFSLPADTLCVGFGFIPRTQLAELAQCTMRYDAPTASWVPQVDRDFETSVPDVWAVGDGGGVAGAIVAELEGEIAGLAVALRCGALDDKTFEARVSELHARLVPMRRFRSGLDRLCTPRPGLGTLATPGTIVCRCEELARSEIDSCITFGGSDSRTLKSMTRLSMGPCQGMTCWPAMCRHIASRTGQSAQAVGQLSVRSPIRPVTLGEVAGAQPYKTEPPAASHKTSKHQKVKKSKIGGLGVSTFGRLDVSTFRRFDVVVIGGGVIGCAVAYELAKRSVHVLLLDKTLPGRATSASAGGLWPVGEAVGLGCGVICYASRANGTPIADDTKFGPEALPKEYRDYLIESNSRFASLAVELGDLSGIDFEYDRGHGLLFAAATEQELAFVKQVKRGLPDDITCEMLTTAEVLELEPGLSPKLLGGAILPGEDQVNPMLLAEAFKRAAIKLGTVFRPKTPVLGLRVESDRVIGVDLEDGFVPCGTVVNAAGAWASQLAATAGLDLPVSPVRGQVVLTEALPPSLSLCLSTSSTYLTQKRHGEIFIGSTTEHVGFDVSVTHSAIQQLCKGAIGCLPMLSNIRIKRVWAGLRPGTPDELPVLGKANGLDGYINATGGFRTGIVAAPLTGEVTAQLITGQEPSFPIESFEMGRFAAERVEDKGSGMKHPTRDVTSV